MKFWNLQLIACTLTAPRLEVWLAPSRIKFRIDARYAAGTKIVAEDTPALRINVDRFASEFTTVLVLSYDTHIWVVVVSAMQPVATLVEDVVIVYVPYLT